MFPLFHYWSDERLPQGSIRLGLSASATLPPEILDEILKHISTDNILGRRILVACALVATWWTGPSQRRLFSSVSIYEGNYQQWLNAGSETHILEYVRSLSHSRGLGTRNKYRMGNLAQDSGEYLSALHKLHSLELLKIHIEHINKAEFRTCFSAFRETLTTLSLDTIATSFGAFVTLVDYFPNVTSLQLRSVDLEPDEGPVPPLSRPLRGKVHLHHIRPHRLDFFRVFAELELEYEELVIDSSSPMRTIFLEIALQISTSTVKYLRLIADYRRE